MTTQIILAALTLLAAIAGIIKFFLLKKDSNPILKEVITHQKNKKLSLKEAEKRAKEGKDVSDRALAGELSPNDANKLRSGKLKSS